MDIIILFFIAVLIYLLPMNDDYLGVKTTLGLKGFLALGIIFHHLSQWVTTGSEFSNFAYMGTYIVSIFFFLSGYGLYYQNEHKPNYMSGFLYKRLSRIFVPFLFISLIYLVYRVANGQVIDIEYFINLFVKGSTIIINGWFVNIIILMYLLFYVSFKLFKKSEVAIFINLLLILGYIFIAIKLNYGFWWYNSSLPFAVGLLWAKYKNRIDSFVNNHYFALLILFTILLFISHRYDFIISKLNITDSYSYALIANLDNVIFTIYFMLFIKKFNFDNKYLNFIGTISFELYMIHGLFMSIFAKYFVSSTINDVIYTVLVLVFSISFAWFINQLLKKIQL